jgi:hypothetical protein
MVNVASRCFSPQQICEFFRIFAANPRFKNLVNYKMLRELTKNCPRKRPDAPRCPCDNLNVIKVLRH